MLSSYLLFSISLFARPRLSRIDSLKQMITSARTDTDKVNYLIILSKAYDCMDTSESLKSSMEALNLAKSIHWNKGVISSNYTIGLIYSFCIGDIPASLPFFQMGINIASSSHDTINMGLGIEYIAQGYGHLGRFDLKIDYYRRFLTLKTGPEKKIGALSNMGGAYSVLGNYTGALTCYDSALQTFNELSKSPNRNLRKDTLSKALLKMAIGDVYLSMGDYEHASGNYKNALSLFEYVKSNEGVIIALTGIGKACHLLRDDESAIKYYNEAVDICTKKADSNANKNEKLVIYNLLGKLYLGKKQIDKALDYALGAVRLIKECPFTKEVPVTYNILGEIYTVQKKYDKAVYYLNSAISLCKQSGELDKEKDALQALSTAYTQMGQPAKALEAYKGYIAIRDSVYSLDKATEVTRHEMNADFAEKRAAISAEQDKKDAIQKAVMDLTLKRQQLAYGTFTAIIILLLVVGILLFNRSRLRKKLEMQMAITGERSRISSEMHDDMGSELSKISLLSEMVKNNAADQNERAHLDNISRSSRELLDKMGEIVWSLNNKYDTLESLIIYIRRYAMEFFSSTDIDCKISMPEHFPELTIEGEVRRDIFLAVKEALHNVLKHSKGDLVKITITTDGHFMSISIQDNGVGVDMAAISAFGNGLGNMKSRVEGLKGRFAMKNDNGTILDFNFPLPDSK
ncbi:MAG: histidine kinase [Flavipsychrobacter sp.]|nr:histidine kinase [Flavipsychrobacter sp.]